MPKVAESHLEARRAQILDAAARCFARTGFHRATMQDICAEAALSPGAVYRYFPGKEAIILEMAEFNRRRNLDLIASVRERTSPLEALRELGNFFFGLVADETNDVSRIDVALWAEACRDEAVRKTLRSSLEAHRDALASLVAQAQAGGAFRTDVEARSVASALVSLFEGLILQNALGDQADVGSYLHVVEAMFSGLVTTDVPAHSTSPSEGASP
jgi:AcrR family transcriptional regulator